MTRSVTAQPAPGGDQGPGSVAIALTGVTKRFGDSTAVNSVTLEIYDNEFFSILGPSGCGKTTLMRMIAGFETPTSGEIVLDGQAIEDVPAHKRDLNMVFQSYALFPHLNVQDNVGFELKVRMRPKTEIASAVEQALDLVRLGGMGKRKPNELSGGQRQRVALARALVGRPKLVLLDEPLGALDLKLRKQMQVELKRMQREVGITFVYVTHDQEEALTMSDRVAVMQEGKLLQVASPRALYDQPATRFVADFIGVSNLMDTKPSTSLRPELVSVHPLGTPSGEDNSTSAEVTEVIFLGRGTEYRLRLHGRDEPLIAQVANSGLGEGFAVGDQVTVSWANSSLRELED